MQEKSLVSEVAYNNPALLEHSQKSQTIFIILLLVQFFGLGVFFVVWLLNRKKQKMNYAD